MTWRSVVTDVATHEREESMDSDDLWFMRVIIFGSLISVPFWVAVFVLIRWAF